MRAVIAESFERIHRSNLIGLTGDDALTITGLATLPDRVTVHAGHTSFDVTVRLDTARERYYYRHGGIMKYVIRDLLDAEGSR